MQNKFFEENVNNYIDSHLNLLFLWFAFSILFDIVIYY
jgi:hypothetical protein